ncbi:flagellin [Cellvibrio sp.]|uniref:flagellin N-terminal helical domain-containing protein n=1 Tax=Cellvibrio sp. TaxID=1965322 RepID=UPI0039648920
MALVINTNISSLSAQRQLSGSGMTLDRATERLSSGLRVNSAKDDAAGLAIATRMTSQVRGLDQAVRNANDGVSLIQTAEGALQESTNILQRMRELAVQSSNGIYSDSDRKTLDAENKQLIAELDRISKTTSFNGRNLLDGTLGSVDLQVGASAGQTITFAIKAMDSKNLGLGSTSADLSGDRITYNGSSDVGQGNIVINGIGLKAITNIGSATLTDTQLSDVIKDINDNVTGVTASGFNIAKAANAGTGVLSASETLRITLGSADGGASVNYDVSNTADMKELVSKINAATGGSVVASLDDAGKLSLSNTTGGSITVAYDNAAPFAAAQSGASLGTITGLSDTGADGTETYNGSIALKSNDGKAITITTGANGTDADLAVLGFRRTEGAGQVLSAGLDSTAQNAALAAGDLKINGTDIGVIAANAGLAAKVSAINAKSDVTGVTAFTQATQSLKLDSTATTTQLVATSNAAVTTGGNLTINGVAAATIADGDSQTAIAAAINSTSASHGVTASIDKNGRLNLFSEGSITLAVSAGTFVANTGIAVGTVAEATQATGDLEVNGKVISFTALQNSDTIVNEFNAQTATTGVTARIDENGALKLSSASTITLKASGVNGFEAAKALGITFTSDTIGSDSVNDTLVIDPRINLKSGSGTPISVEVTSAGASATKLLNQNTSLASAVTGSAISNLSISTKAGATAALKSIDTALDTINDTRSQLGSINNRLDFTVSNLTSISEKTTAARSRIVDADFASETANLSRSTVLQQAATAMLAQANQRPQNVLSLLR